MFLDDLKGNLYIYIYLIYYFPFLCKHDIRGHSITYVDGLASLCPDTHYILVVICVLWCSTFEYLRHNETTW